MVTFVDLRERTGLGTGSLCIILESVSTKKRISKSWSVISSVISSSRFTSPLLMFQQQVFSSSCLAVFGSFGNFSEVVAVVEFGIEKTVEGSSSFPFGQTFVLLLFPRAAGPPEKLVVMCVGWCSHW